MANGRRSGSGREVGPGSFGSGGRLQALVASLSPVNRLVIGKICEGAGLRPQAKTPDEAALLLADWSPDFAILDGGPQNNDCDSLLAHLERWRRLSQPRRPRTVLLVQGNHHHRENALFDAIVPKPITPDLLQPVLIRMQSDLESGSGIP